MTQITVAEGMALLGFTPERGDRHMGSALVQAENTAALADTLQSMVQQHQLYIQVCKDLLNDSDYANIRQTRFRKRTGWAKLRRAFNVSLKVLSEEYIEHGDVWGYQFMVEASLPNGRAETADGACFSDEFQFGNIRATHHNVRSKALTRAKNRATSDILGAGDVSFEEMIDEEPAQEKPAPAKSAPRHWINSAPRRQKFWAWVHNEMGLTDQQVHTALGVESVYEYEGTAEEAFAQIQNWLNDQIELEAAEREADAVEDAVKAERVPLEV